MCGILCHSVETKHSLHQYREEQVQKQLVIMVRQMSSLTVMGASHFQRNLKQ